VELDTAFRDLTFDSLGKTAKGDFYPSVGLRTPGEHVRVNFGQKPFVFDIGGYVLVCPFDLLMVAGKIRSARSIDEYADNHLSL
jgi:hypothetical protein